MDCCCSCHLGERLFLGGQYGQLDAGLGSTTQSDMVESDLWGLGNYTRGLLNAFAIRRMLGKYGQDSLDMLTRKLSDFRIVAA